jgi:hypothetical protein
LLLHTHKSPRFQSAFRGAENEQGLVAWELAASHHSSAVYILLLWSRPLHADFLAFLPLKSSAPGVCVCVNSNVERSCMFARG